jgi:hypothetical protein
MDWPRIEPGGRPAANRLSHGTAYYIMFLQ